MDSEKSITAFKILKKDMLPDYLLNKYFLLICQ